MGASDSSSLAPEQEPHSHPWELKGWGWGAHGKEQFDLVQLLFILHRHCARHWGYLYLQNSPGGALSLGSPDVKEGPLGQVQGAAAFREVRAEGLGLVWGAQERSVRARHVGRVCKGSKDPSYGVLRPESQCTGPGVRYFSLLVLSPGIQRSTKGLQAKAASPGELLSLSHLCWALRPVGTGSE